MAMAVRAGASVGVTGRKKYMVQWMAALGDCV